MEKIMSDIKITPNMLPLPTPPLDWEVGTVMFRTPSGEIVPYYTNKQREALEKKEIEKEKQQLESSLKENEIINKIKL
jgi:hypothetical protein